MDYDESQRMTPDLDEDLDNRCSYCGAKSFNLARSGDHEQVCTDCRASFASADKQDRAKEDSHAK